MVSKWRPDVDELQTTSIWSFPDRRIWATHNVSYRGNWSPYIQRNKVKVLAKNHELIEILLRPIYI